jgi:large subunit ribosomal protein L35
MNKPIYRHLAEKKWRDYRRKIQIQRIETMHIVPDIVPKCDPVVDVWMRFGGVRYGSGDYVPSNIGERPPSFRVPTFARGERLLSIAVIDPDVPNLETDSFDSRCHFLASNIKITPTQNSIDLAKLPAHNTLMRWLPPTAQKGSPYHRLAVVFFQHKDNVPMDLQHMKQKLAGKRDGFSARTFTLYHMMSPIAAVLFRVKWDDTMAEVMARHKIEGANIELKRKKVEPLPYKRRETRRMR